MTHHLEVNRRRFALALLLTALVLGCRSCRRDLHRQPCTAIRRSHTCCSTCWRLAELCGGGHRHAAAGCPPHLRLSPVSGAGGAGPTGPRLVVMAVVISREAWLPLEQPGAGAGGTDACSGRLRPRHQPDRVEGVRRARPQRPQRAQRLFSTCWATQSHRSASSSRRS